MVFTEFKSIQEIEFSLKDVKRVALLSCGTCSNLTDTGGSAGLKTMKAVMKGLGKEVVFSHTAAALCPESIVKETLRSRKRKLKKCGAIVVLSCSSGFKTVSIHSPGVRIVSALDTTGTGPISETDDPRALSVCRSCGECVISFTDGICPYTACAVKSKYGPCAKYKEGDESCQVDKTEKCVWHTIKSRVDISPLAELKKIHESPGKEYPVKTRRNVPAAVTSVMGFAAAHSGIVDLIIRSLARRVGR